ncbi:MAG: class I SAM-dependent rRNA methyltransferase [Oscillospiraceae bacterium]|nr:class I SAM-dependent rRNA methyltransferase [Oscillospiraceae bacterium]
MERPFQSVTVTDKGARFLRSGHPWVYAGEVLTPGDPCPDGEIADVFTQKGKWLGAGFYNSRSLLRVRLLTRNGNDKMDEDFFLRRLRYALAYRRQVMGADFDNCRLVFGEADGFPGWTVDRFGDVLVSEVLSLGIERRRDMLYGLLRSVLGEMGVAVSVIYERNESALREKEGLERGKGPYVAPGLVAEPSGHTEIRENGIYYDVDYINGQKTGFFLDQKYNRSAAARLAPGRRVLDCCTHTGAFALNCAAAGAESVTALDVSEDALEQARRNAARNGLAEKIQFVRADMFEYLTQLAASRQKPFDYIILDPPAFTKSSATVESARRGYREINRRAMQLLPRGGYLATCSCSHFMTAPLFREMLADAAGDASVSLRQIEERRQSPDHPILWGVPETEYLKFFLFQVV